MAGIKETIDVNVQGALLGAQEGGFSFLNQFKNLPRWKHNLILGIAIAIIPLYLIARFGTEQFLAQRYGREALSAQAAFKTSQAPAVGSMTIIRNPNNTYSAAVLVTNPNLDLSATGVTYSATFQSSDKKTMATATGTLYLLPNEKKYVVFPKIDSGSATVSSGTLKLDNIDWQKKLNIPEVKFKKMFSSMKPLLRRGINFGGDSTSDYRNIYGLPGKFQNKHHVYRKTGKLCERHQCKGVIIRKVVGGRSAHFCSVHQTPTPTF